MADIRIRNNQEAAERAAENCRQYNITRLKEGYKQTCQDLLKEKQDLRRSNDPKNIWEHQLRIKRLEKKKVGFKHVFLTKYGLKIETRGRPPLPPEKRTMNNQTKLTVRINKENAEYIASLKKDNQIDSYGQFFDFLITAFRQQSRQGRM